MADFKIDGRMKVKKLKEDFFNAFGGVLRVYNGKEKADDDATLASIRSNDKARGGEMQCRGNRTVTGFKQEMWDVFGIKVQVATKDDWIIVLDAIKLSSIKEIPNYASKEQMQQFVSNIKSGIQKFVSNIKSGIQKVDETEKNKLSQEMPLPEKIEYKYIEEEALCEEANKELHQALSDFFEQYGVDELSMSVDTCYPVWSYFKKYLVEEGIYSEDELNNMEEDDIQEMDEVLCSRDSNVFPVAYSGGIGEVYAVTEWDDGVCVSFRYVRTIGALKFDERYENMVLISKYFDDNGDEHDEGVILMAVPQIPQTYIKIKEITRVIREITSEI